MTPLQQDRDKIELEECIKNNSEKDKATGKMIYVSGCEDKKEKYRENYYQDEKVKKALENYNHFYGLTGDDKKITRDVFEDTKAGVDGFYAWDKYTTAAKVGSMDDMPIL